MCFLRFTIYVCVDISPIMYISASPVPAIVLWLGARWPRCLPLLATTLRRLQGFLFQMNRWKWVLLQLHKPLIRLDLGHSCRQFLSLPCVIVKRKKNIFMSFEFDNWFSLNNVLWPSRLGPHLLDFKNIPTSSSMNLHIKWLSLAWVPQWILHKSFLLWTRRMSEEQPRNHRRSAS